MSNSKKQTKRRPWPEKRRQKQAETCRKTKPWKHTTGPKTRTGKATSSQNALKSGLHTAEMRALRKALSKQTKFLRDLKIHDG